MYNVSQLWWNWLAKKPLPSVWRNGTSCPKCTTEGWKIHEIARNVSGIIDRNARTVANTVPKRSPNSAGMKSNRIPTTEIPTVHHAMNGERSGKAYRLADRIRVKVARVDLETTKIDFVLVDVATKVTTKAASLPPSMPPRVKKKARQAKHT